uniref:Ent-kaurenoic acid oxidase 1 n=1 Tax=Cajanus cajan TaxID=3821 RepID=A0A151R0K1_CAJCA|nr:Ent-kaurenoic acid oxidase 1 [Cajanus cajan]
MSVATLLASYVLVNKFVRRLNGWYYDLKVGNKKTLLPPGDMGWPLIGNIIPFIKDLSSGQLDSFINKLVSKFEIFPFLCFFPFLLSYSSPSLL